MERKPILLAATICLTLIVASTLGLFIVLQRYAPEPAQVRAWLGGKASFAERARVARPTAVVVVPPINTPFIEESGNGSVGSIQGSGSRAGSAPQAAPAPSQTASGAPAALEPKRIRTIPISDPLASSVLTGAQKTPSDADPVPVPQSGTLPAAAPASEAAFPTGSIPLPQPRNRTKASGR